MQIENRREFLKFLGYGSLGLSQLGFLTACSSSKKKSALFPSRKDDVVLENGLQYQTLISWNDPISKKEVFGFNNDYINIHALSPTELIMWVNHEYVNPLFVSGMERTKKNVDIEKSLVGGSLISVQKKDGKWKHVPGNKYNRGVRGNKRIPFANGVKVKGSRSAEGTLANCAGGKTPWNTFLTCEENYDGFYGERKNGETEIKYNRSRYDWHLYYPKNVPEHYGWVVEINPLTGEAQKHTNLGRFAHESATCVTSKNHKVVVYSGDDKNNEHLYKFVSTSGSDFKKGVLYVANIKAGKWLPLDLELSPILKKSFKTQLDVVTYPREAAKILGATELNRPEDIEVHPITGDIYVALTNNKKKGDFHGSILKLTENGGDYESLSFSSETFRFGGEQNGFSCPDNLAFDSKGNLWFVTDMSGDKIGKPPYTPFGNNGLFLVPMKGPDAGTVIQLGSAPMDAEFTGLCFDPEEETLFLSVQHPGELTKDINQPTSTWPTGKMPKPSVIAITGPLLTKYTKA